MGTPGMETTEQAITGQGMMETAATGQRTAETAAIRRQRLSRRKRCSPQRLLQEQAIMGQRTAETAATGQRMTETAAMTAGIPGMMEGIPDMTAEKNKKKFRDTPLLKKAPRNLWM